MEPYRPPPAPVPCWWKEAIVYQIYPASFKDSNGDGIGDIPGIIQMVPYFKHWGANVVLLSPVYKSPGKDMGYDVEDYRAINPSFGTMEHMERLIEELHACEIKIVMDLAVNHTSDQHEWFRESRSSKDNGKRDWYVWRGPKFDADGNKQPPNNWQSVYGGSAWTYDQSTAQYYLHIFDKSQPDLNWDNEDVREAVHDLMKFWLDKGIDGFRLDVIDVISKAPGLPDAPVVRRGERYQPASHLFANGPRLHEFLREIHTEVLDTYHVFTVGDMPWCATALQAMGAINPREPALDTIFNYALADLDSGTDGRFSPSEMTLKERLRELRSRVNAYQRTFISLSGWSSIFLENNSEPRAYRYLQDPRVIEQDEGLRMNAAKMLAVFMIGQRGTLFIHQGQEIGMVNIPRSWPIEEFRDILTQNKYNSVLEEFGAESEQMKEFMEEVYLKARDHGRTPMQWNSGPNAGFTDAYATPWMRVNDSYKQINVAAQFQDPNSLFAFWRQLLILRNTQLKGLLLYSDWCLVADDHPKIIAWKRFNQFGHSAIFIMNFSPEPATWDRLDENDTEKYFLHAKVGEIRQEGPMVELEGYGAMILLNDLAVAQVAVTKLPAKWQQEMNDPNTVPPRGFR